MVIAFCGHSQYIKNLEDEKLVLEILKKRVANNDVDFLLGEYGGFDNFAYGCVKQFKTLHPKSNLIFVTPYISLEYQKNQIEYRKERFDMVIYPSLEKVPPRYAISHRNRWIVEQADIIIAYITHQYGGAYAMYKYAKRKNKEIYNISLLDID